jgi:hypothetical protein
MSSRIFNRERKYSTVNGDLLENNGLAMRHSIIDPQSYSFYTYCLGHSNLPLDKDPKMGQEFQAVKLSINISASIQSNFA